MKAISGVIALLDHNSYKDYSFESLEKEEQEKILILVEETKKELKK